MVKYKGKNIKKRGFINGIIIGIVFVITSLILDAIITVPLFVKDFSFFLNPMILIGYLEAIIVTGIIGEISK